MAVFVACNSGEPPAKEVSSNSRTYRNLSADARYVGMEACQSCHADIYETFRHTGMGLSFDSASSIKSSASFDQHAVVHDPTTNLYYRAFLMNKALYIEQFQLAGNDTLHKRTEKVSYIVGSGQHTNSHLLQINGYLYQMPMTFYTQKKRWDLPPGFERGNNSRFNRTIGAECITCHNAYPTPDPGADNRYLSIPKGIDCERCHGPGSIHVEEKKQGKIVNTAQEADYSIVNPKRLPFKLQMSICQRCHLQGNAVLKPGKSFFDFKPGMMLSDVFTVFMPRYNRKDASFIMASHPDRLAMSKCFQQSNGKLSCISCHNPHQSVTITGKNKFNNTCNSCHPGEKGLQTCKLPELARAKNKDGCVGCHMPASHTVDIPHVNIHDHYIRKPVKEVMQKGAVVGIAPVNEINPDALTKTKAWLQYFERFESRKSFLDSAKTNLAQIKKDQGEEQFQVQVHLSFLERNTYELLKLAESKQPEQEKDAWTAYRLGEAAFQGNVPQLALNWLKRATDLKPRNLDFQNKYASCLIQNGKVAEAITIFQMLLKLQPAFSPAKVNLGFYALSQGDDQTAALLYREALKEDPWYEEALLNQIGLMLFRGQKAEAKKQLKIFLKRYPQHLQARQLLNSL